MLHCIRTLCLFLFLFFSYRISASELTTLTKLSPISSHFENIYFSNLESTFHCVGEFKELSHYIDTSSIRGYSWKILSKNHLLDFDSTKNHFGTTLMVMEQPTSAALTPHFFHFLEHLLILFDNVQSYKLPTVKLFLIASDGFDMNFSWKGPNNVNEHLIKALFPEADILTFAEFKDKNKDRYHKFSHLVTSDRGLFQVKFKPFYMSYMLNLYYQNLNKDYTELMSKKVKNYLGIFSDKKNRKHVNITYIKRKQFRWVESSIESALLKSISTIPGVQLNAVDLAEMSFKDQIELIDRTDILIGAHGNGFSHTLFLNPYSTVIELYPKHSLHCEYRIFSELRNVNYFAWVDNEGLYDYDVLKSASEKGQCGFIGFPRNFIIMPHVYTIVDLIEKEVKKRLK
jgi:hypothetical protein